MGSSGIRLLASTPHYRVNKFFRLPHGEAWGRILDWGGRGYTPGEQLQGFSRIGGPDILIFMADEASHPLLDDLDARGLIAQESNRAGIARLLASRQAVYCGFDPTAESLHIGNLLPLLALRRFQLAGHRPVALVGGATGLIGDPSGKTEERKLNSREVVKSWVDNIRPQIEQILDCRPGPSGAILVDNYDWHSQIGLISYLRDYGKHFSINAMLSKDSVKSRVSTENMGLSYTEFSYMLLQSIDFLELNQRNECRLQIGGSDQWGNMTAGIDLVRRVNGQETFCLTFPLITTASGKKFGKSEGNAVWLDKSLTSPYEFYQYWINTDDRDVGRFLRFFTLLTVDYIGEVELSHGERPEVRHAQKVLAREVTTLVHGHQAMKAAELASDAIFGTSSVREVPLQALNEAAHTIPNIKISSFPIPLIAALKDLGLVASLAEARRAIRGGGVSINDEHVTTEDRTVDITDLIEMKLCLIRFGKKKVGFCISSSS